MKYTTETFIERAKEVHNNAYTYEKVEYVNSYSKVTITCPVHGDFLQSPGNHINGRKCTKCRKYAVSSKKLTTEEFVEKAKKMHGDKYDYAKSLYTNNSGKIVITCPMHGDFEQTAGNHLRGSKCRACAKEEGASKHRGTLETFIEKASEVHDNTYTYEKAVYINARTPMVITCPEHGDFYATYDNHVNKKSGCPVCKKGNYCTEKPTILYYLHVDNSLYKIGITSKDTVSARFGTDISKIEVIFSITLPSGYDAYELEQKILQKYKEYAYTGPKVLVSGNTEMFTENVLQLNNNATLEEITTILSILE